MDLCEVQGHSDLDCEFKDSKRCKVIPWQKTFNYYFMCMSVSECRYVHKVHAGVLRGQKSELEPMELE